MPSLIIAVDGQRRMRIFLCQSSLPRRQAINKEKRIFLSTNKKG
jgi:hypothetical protein